MNVHNKKHLGEIPDNKRVVLYFTNSLYPFSYLIRCRTKFLYSHCAVRMPDDSIIESAASRGGVKRDSLENFLGRSKNWCSREYYCENPEKLYAFLESQLGTKYDYEGLVGYETKDRDFQDPIAWFCSELTEAGFVAGGSPHFDDGTTSVSPKELFYKGYRTIEYH